MNGILVRCKNHIELNSINVYCYTITGIYCIYKFEEVEIKVLF